MSAKSAFNDPDEPEQTISQQWSLFSPEPAHRSSIVTPISDQRGASPTDAGVRHCRFCTEVLPPGARECPLCLREVSDPAADRHPAIGQTPAVDSGNPPTGTSMAAATLAGVAPMPALTPESAASAASGGAVYTLETPAECPECGTEINTIHVIRVLRTQVSFTSTLPRKAYVIACPSCRKLLSAGLSGLL